MRKLYILIICTFFYAVRSSAQNVPNGVNTPAAVAIQPLPVEYPPDFEMDTLKYLRSYVRTFTPIYPLKDADKFSMYLPDSSNKILISTRYLDDMGRPIQTVIKQASPSKKDLVIPTLFDEFGNQSLHLLPYVAATKSDGRFKYLQSYADSAFYKSSFPEEQVYFGKTSFDGSPLNRVAKVMPPGNSWAGSGKGKTIAYRTNSIADSVRLFTINISSEEDIPASSVFYLPGTLYVQEIIDESGNKTITYTDETGKQILSKTQLVINPNTAYTGWLCTYFVYDEMNKLRFVIPPKATELLVASVWSVQANLAAIKNLCYSYYYDALGRVVTKCLPAKGKTYLIYDANSKVVLSQDSVLRATSQWQFVKYDDQNRINKSGLITLAGLSRDAVAQQAAVSTDYPTVTGTYTILTEAYYDNYSWVGPSGSGLSSTLLATDINGTNFNTAYNTAPDYAQQLVTSSRIRGAVTGTKTLVVGTDTYLYALSLYDDNGRVIQSSANNITGGKDVSTIQYSFTSQVLRSFMRHQKSGTNPQTHTLLTAYAYDHMGRLLGLNKQADGQPLKKIADYSYNELGQLKSKVLGSGIETQNFTYNIMGTLRGINKDYAQAQNNNSWFGEELSYDYGFTQNQLNGNIAGIKWRSKGDGEQRAYGYTYDAAGRLTKADFTQNNAGWNTSAGVDYSVSNLTYDANGNILSMVQKGLKLNTSSIIDSLVYGYNTNSNQLQYVTDKANDANSRLGDFKEVNNNATADYAYDGNGNLLSDQNKKITSIVYNFLDLPQTITVAGKGTITYTYDAKGAKLKKTVTEGSSTTITTYVNGFVYKASSPQGGGPVGADTLQFAFQEEGRLRPTVNGQLTTFDYFIKDHLGNIRMVLTDKKDTAFYPAATMELANNAVESAFYTKIPETRVAKPAGYIGDQNTLNYVCKVNGAGNKIGPGITLKVMSGDKFNIKANSWYKTNGVLPAPPANPLLDLLNALNGGVGNLPGAKRSPLELEQSGIFTPGASKFLDEQPNPQNKPKAYLNWVLFDEQFNLVQGSSGAELVGADNAFTTHVKQNLPVNTNGYLYIYVSNATPNIDVYFDNLQVTHLRGPLVEENAYYPYGLAMAGISSKALPQSAANKYKGNAGTEFGSEEWADGSGLELYETGLRRYDAQIGRFTGVDILAESTADLTPYHFAANNPVMFVDPSGALSKTADEGDNPVNPASFSNAASLLDYIIKNGIGGFDNEYMFWSFASSGGGSGMNLASFQYSNDISYTSGGISIIWSGSINDGVNAGFGNMSTLNTFVLGTKFLSVQNLWDGAMQYGEANRDATRQWFNGEQSYDVMWQHNYDVYKERAKAGLPLQRAGDRASYTEKLASFSSYYTGDQQGKMMYGGMVAIMAAPFVIEFVPVVIEGYSLTNASIASLETDTWFMLTSAKNALVTTFGNAAIGYTTNSITTFYLSQTLIPNLMNAAYTTTIGNPVMFVAIWQAVKHAQGIHGMQNPLTKP
jgi:RHS repeat-associated protein